MEKRNNITIICGHYGCGKTNLSLNLALEKAGNGKKTTLVDIDIVNPYFRSSEYGNLLSKQGVKLIAPTFAGSTLDTPVLPPEIYSIFTPEGREVIVDVGGDDAGITALAGMSEQIKENGYTMLYVINKNRLQSGTPEKAAELLREIEKASHLKAVGIINNTHLGTQTTYEDVMLSQSFAYETANLVGLQVLYSTIPDFALPEGGLKSDNYKVIKRLVLFPWEQAEI